MTLDAARMVARHAYRKTIDPHGAQAANRNLKDRKLKYFIIALGVGADSPVASLFEEMFHDLKERIERGETLTSVEDIDSLDNRDRFTSEVIDRMKIALSQGLSITIGNFSSENNLAEMTLCTEIFARTGFFARVPEPGKREPFWSPHGPELMDISITNWCDKGCVFCYKSSPRRGSHMALADYKRVIDEAAYMGTFQGALGGGNPNQHPHFVEILDYTWSKGIVPNYTTTGRKQNLLPR
ncbi:radical SAM protein [Brucella intermedia]|uniref:radical SAM protein n=1 Tax=Brucella intermedia TaxID=94625 RepID=UPI001AEE8F0D|nr:radical SAM protein [Brucella intermedia]